MLGPHRAHRSIHGGQEGLNTLSHAAKMRIRVHLQRIQPPTRLLGEADLRSTRNLQVSMHIKEVNARNLMPGGSQRLGDHFSEREGFTRAGHAHDQGMTVHKL
ncbi:hypothetical protein D3C81_1888080 [compost metagenome]